MLSRARAPWHRGAMKLPLVALVFALAAAGCTKKDAPPSETAKVAPSASTSSVAATPRGKLAWTDPPGWTRRPGSNPMRVAEYSVPHVAPDAEDGECVVTTFGAGQGGSVDANIDRWVRQFEPESAGALQKSDRTVAGMKITTVELAGTFRGMAMPGGPQGPAAPKRGVRMVAAIVEAPEGAYFFKLTGPDVSVKAARPAFDALLDSAHR